jgi:hypothetical protein
MIRLEIKNGVQKLTEICENCKCHVRNLTTDDILVKKSSHYVINSKGEEVTNTSPREACYCEECAHD